MWRAAIFWISVLVAQRIHGKMRVCYDATGNPTSDFPCDPVSNESACCFSGYMCVTSLYCALKGEGGSRVPSCTDRTFRDNACPFPFAFSFDTQQYDFFSYAQNATICDDGTICMNPGNRTCCAQGKGKREVHYNNNAAMPTGVAQLDHYYANGDYRGTAALRTTLPPASQNALANKTGTALPATTTGPPSSLDSSSNRSSNNYSRGIRAGVGAGIGASLGTMLIVLLVIWYRRRRPNLAGGSSSTIGNLAKRSELGCEWVGEMDAGPPPPLKEMDENCKSGKTLVQEMPGLIWQEIQTSPTPNISVKHKAVNSP